jgi:hypothetical protein
VVTALAFVALARAPSASAQGAASRTGPADDSLVELAHRLYGQSRARIRLSSGGPSLVILGPRLVGDTLQFTRYAAGSWTLDTTGGRHQILLAEVARLQVRRSAWEKGAIIGFLVGAAAIEAVNAAGKYQIDRGETLFFGLFFGTAGAFVGAPTGALFHTWKTLYGP